MSLLQSGIVPKRSVTNTHTQVLELELGVGLVSRVSLVSHTVRVRAMLCMLV